MNYFLRAEGAVKHMHCTAFIRRHPFLPSCTYPPRAPGTPLAVRYYSTELAPDMEEEEEEVDRQYKS